MTGAPHDHAQPGTAEQRAVLMVAHAILNGANAEVIHACATVSGACPSCTAVAAVQLAFALAAAVDGQAWVTEELRARLTALLDAAQAELGSAPN